MSERFDPFGLLEALEKDLAQLNKALAEGADSLLEAGQGVAEQLRELDHTLTGGSHHEGNPRPRSIDPEEAARLHQQGLTNLEIAETLGVTPLTVFRALRAAGVRRPVGAPPRISREDVLRLHQEGLSPREIAPQVGASEARVGQIITEAGLAAHPAPPTTTERERAAEGRRGEVLRLHREGLPPIEIAQRVAVTPVTVYRILAEEGLRPNPTAEAELARQRREEVIRLHQAGVSGSEIARRMGVSEPRVVQILREFRPPPSPSRALEFEERAFALLPHVESLRRDPSPENTRLTELMLQNLAAEARAHIERLPEFPRPQMEEERWRVAFVHQRLLRALEDLETFRACQAEMREAQATSLPRLVEQAQRCIDRATQLLRECCPPTPRPSPVGQPA